MTMVGIVASSHRRIGHQALGHWAESWALAPAALVGFGLKNPRTACIIVFTEESINLDSPSWWMYSSMCAR